MAASHLSEANAEVLKSELLGLFEHIQKIRREIAAIRRPGETNDRFNQMSDELDAIVEHTESATNAIMENVEAISDLVAQARTAGLPSEVEKTLAKVDAHAGEIFSACSFQDITGQRITKVVRSLKFIEERINVLIGMWGRNALAEIAPDAEEKEGDAALLNGPQLAGEGVSQDEVDRLLKGADMVGNATIGQSDIDKLFG